MHGHEVAVTESSFWTIFWIACAISAVISAIGSAIAGRSIEAGAWGLVFGPLGIFIAALLSIRDAVEANRPASGGIVGGERPRRVEGVKAPCPTCGTPILFTGPETQPATCEHCDTTTTRPEAIAASRRKPERD